MLYGGWGTTIDLNRRVGFQVTAKPGCRLYFSELANFNSGGGRQTVTALSSWVWGYLDPPIQSADARCAGDVGDIPDPVWTGQ